MAYGSPDRIEDVPAYYADIRGGRPISPENLADLVDRYRTLGIEDSNPLNEITEATRAALQDELGAARVHGHAALDAAHRRRGRARARGRRDHDRRPRARAALLVHVDREVPRPARRGSRRTSGAPLRRALGGRSRLRRPARGESRVRGRRRTSSSRRTRSRRGSSTRAIRTGTSCSRRRSWWPSAPASRLVVLLPERVADRGALARAGHRRAPGRPRRGGRPGRPALSRSASSPTTSRSAGISTPRPRRGPTSSGSASAGSRCRTPTRPSSACSPGSSGRPPLYRPSS